MPMLIIAITVFLAVFLGLAAILLWMSRSSDPVERRLQRVRDEPSAAGGRGEVPGNLPENLIAMDPASYSSLRADLTHAGVRGQYSVQFYWVSRVFLAAILGFAGYVIQDRLNFTPTASFLVTAFGIVAGFMSPYLWVQSRVTRRRDDIRRAIPNVLDLIIVCVEAGLSLNAAVQRIAREMRHTYKDLATELNILNQEIFLGISRSDAFRNLALRTGVDELRSLATVLMQSDRLGTSVAEVLRVQADTIRVKRRQRAMEQAQKMPVKLLFPLILFILPELLVVILGPAAIQLLRSLAQTAR